MSALEIASDRAQNQGECIVSKIQERNREALDLFVLANANGIVHQEVADIKAPDSVALRRVAMYVCMSR